MVFITYFTAFELCMKVWLFLKWTYEVIVESWLGQIGVTCDFFLLLSVPSVKAFGAALKYIQNLITSHLHHYVLGVRKHHSSLGLLLGWFPDGLPASTLASYSLLMAPRMTFKNNISQIIFFQGWKVSNAFSCHLEQDLNSLLGYGAFPFNRWLD